ncbi:hypothetical protein V2J09_021020 [Rumex salicifolius]
MDALFSLIDECCKDGVYNLEYEKADDVLTDFCSGFKYEEDDDDFLKLLPVKGYCNHGYGKDSDQVYGVVPVKGYGNHGLRKVLKLPNNYLNEGDGEGDEVKHSLVQDGSHGRPRKMLKIPASRFVPKKSTADQQNIHINVGDEVEREVNNGCIWRRRRRRQRQSSTHQMNGSTTLKRIKQLSKGELEAKVELSKAKLRNDYRKTLPTRHSKDLEIDQIPDVKRVKKAASVAPSVPKRKLHQEARG